MGVKNVMRKGALSVALAMAMAPAHALAMSDPMVEGARLCTQHFPAEEQRNAIPAHLLAAISSTESGRWHNGLGLALPWPWTINVEGKGYYFNSKAEAIAQTTALMKRGTRSIDVGCMQVNLMHHPDAFASLDEAFDPSTNVAYAAKFLRANYNSTGDWVKATAAYHSRTPVYGRQYLGQIERSWNRIVSKVQQARAMQGLPATNPERPKFSTTQLAAANPSSGLQPISVKSRTGKSLAAVKSQSSSALVVKADTSAPKPLRQLADTHNVRIIKVTEQAKTAPTTMVVNNAQTLPPAADIKTADARDVTVGEVMVRGSSDTARQVHILGGSADTPVSAASGGSSITRFVFAN